jgi:glucose-6-phosphate 1-dehydrogenase
MSDAAKPALEPAIIVIFGITGDLSQRYLLPSLYHLFQEQLLHKDTQIVGLTRQAMDTNELFANVELCINETDNICDPVAIKAIREHTELLQFDPNVKENYDTLLARLNSIEADHGVCMNRLYYLSIPPQVFETTVNNLGAAGLNKSCQHGTAKTRVLVEKPFGYDLASAEELVANTAAVFKEEQIFRIDHYVAKETVQNILVFRSQNPIFASIWDHTHVEDITITASEKIGIEGRANFYEGVGAVRDFIQSHLMQLLAIVTMELPEDLSSSDAIHSAKQALLKAISPADPAEAVRGQYETYKEEVKNPDSTTETFASIGLHIDDERWQGVPVRITTGKALEERRTEISITFTNPNDASSATNLLTFRIQPNEGIHLQLRVKKPSFAQELQEATMDFNYQQTFGIDSNHPSAYERVLVDAVRGDRTLFATSDEVILSWRVLQPVIAAWKDNDTDMKVYANNSTGPER